MTQQIRTINRNRRSEKQQPEINLLAETLDNGLDFLYSNEEPNKKKSTKSSKKKSESERSKSKRKEKSSSKNKKEETVDKTKPRKKSKRNDSFGGLETLVEITEIETDQINQNITTKLPRKLQISHSNSSVNIDNLNQALSQTNISSNTKNQNNKIEISNELIIFSDEDSNESVHSVIPDNLRQTSNEDDNQVKILDSEHEDENKPVLNQSVLSNEARRSSSLIKFRSLGSAAVNPSDTDLRGSTGWFLVGVA